MCGLEEEESMQLETKFLRLGTAGDDRITLRRLGSLLDWRVDTAQAPFRRYARPSWRVG